MEKCFGVLTKWQGRFVPGHNEKKLPFDVFRGRWYILFGVRGVVLRWERRLRGGGVFRVRFLHCERGRMCNSAFFEMTKVILWLKSFYDESHFLTEVIFRPGHFKTGLNLKTKLLRYDPVTIWNNTFFILTRSEKTKLWLAFSEMTKVIFWPVGILKEVPSLWLGQSIKGLSVYDAPCSLTFLCFCHSDQVRKYKAMTHFLQND